jgi:hypothetical protein
MLTYALGLGLRGLDTVIGPESEGDVPYGDITQSIQDGQWDSGILGWDSIVSAFIDEYVATGLTRAPAFLAVADGAFGGAGIIHLAEPPAPVDEYVVKPAYMFGAFRR